MTRFRVRLLFIALLLAFGSAQAQTKKEMAATLLQLQQSSIENIGRAIAAQEAQRFLEGAGRYLERLPADKRAAVGQQIQADVRQFHDEIEPMLRERATRLSAAQASMIEERFSEDELKQLIAWVESPVSRKFGQFSNEFANALAEKIVADARPAVEPKIKALEATVSKRLGLPAAPASAASAPKKK